MGGVWAQFLRTALYTISMSPKQFLLEQKTRSTRSENDVTHAIQLKLHEQMNKNKQL